MNWFRWGVFSIVYTLLGLVLFEAARVGVSTWELALVDTAALVGGLIWAGSAN